MRRSLFRQFEQVNGTVVFNDMLDVELAELCGRKYYTSNAGAITISGSTTVLSDSTYTFEKTQVNDYVVLNGTTNSGVHQIVDWLDDHSVALAGTAQAEDPISYDLHYYKNLEDDLNYIRSQLKRVMGGNTWTDDPCTNLCDMSYLIPKRPNYVGETTQYPQRPGTVSFSISDIDQVANLSSGAPSEEYTDSTTSANPGDSMRFTDDNTMVISINGGFYPADKGILRIYKDGVVVGELDLEQAWNDDGCQYEQSESDVGSNPDHSASGNGTDIINLTARRCMNDSVDGYGYFWPAYQIASMNAELTLDAGVNGLIKVEHSVDGEQSYIYSEFFVDLTDQTINASAPSVAADAVNDHYLSGVPYAGAGSTFEVTISNNDSLFDRGYVSQPVTIRLAQFNAADYSPTYSDLGLSTPTAITDTVGSYTYTVTVGSSNFRDMDARAQVTFRNVFVSATSGDSNAGIFRIDTYTQTSTDTVENFDDESYRFIGDSTDENTRFNDTSIERTDSQWDSSVSILTQTDVDGYIGLVEYAGYLKYPDIDHSSFTPSGPDYSGASGNARYYRLFLAGGAFNQGRIRFVGWSNALDVVKGSTISVHLRLPNCTDYSNGNTEVWQDLSVDQTIYGGNGCLGTDSTGEYVTFSFGTTSSSSYGNRLILRITATGAFPQLNGIVFEPTI